MKICGIYRIISKTQKIYIGQSVDIHGRWDYYKKYSAEGQPKLHKSLNKHGFENHKFEIIEECSKEMLNEREIYWIQFYDSFNTEHGMNLRSGGDCSIFSEESRERMSAAGKGKIITEEHKNNISKANKGMKSPTFGKVMSDEEKQKLSLAQKGRVFTQEHRNNLGKSQIGNKKGLGKKRTEEQKLRLSQANKGKIMSEEQKLKLSEIRKGKKLSPESIRKREETKKRNRYLKFHTTQSIIFRSQIINGWTNISKNLPSYTN